MIAAGRIASLDLIRGVAVLGILLMNIVAFGMPEAAYSNPAAYGAHGPFDTAAWAINAALVDGRMRGLFSFLFGASLLLVTDRAEAAGVGAARVHFSRMAWLLAFGIAHLFLVWWGDILQHYALVGAIAFFLRRLETHRLIILATLLLAIELLLCAGLPVAMAMAVAAIHAPHPSAAALANYRDFVDTFGRPSAAVLARDLAGYRGGYATEFGYRWPDAIQTPWRTLAFVGPETLAYMMLGMAALKSGLLAGAWPRARYRRWAAVCFGIGLPGYAALTWWTWHSGFDMEVIALATLVLSVPLRPVMIVGWACLILLLARPGGRLTGRLEAAGRMAFTNYLATSLLCTTFFYGYGLGWYGHLSRAALYLVVLVVWLLILGWSEPWLRRFRYGPFEWLWRSLARGRLQAMRGEAPGSGAAELHRSLAAEPAAHDRATLDQRARLALQQRQRALEQRPQLSDMLQRALRRVLRLDAVTRDRLDRLGQRAERLRPELTRFALQRVRGDHHGGSVMGAHRLFQRDDRLVAVLAEIAENAHESCAKLAARSAIGLPIDQGTAFERHVLFLRGLAAH